MRDFQVYPTRRQQAGILGLILDALFGKKKPKSTMQFMTERTRRGERPVKQQRSFSMNGQTRYHAEVKLALLGREVRVNIFADTLPEIYRDLANVCDQIPDGLASQAKAEPKADPIRKDAKPPEAPAKKPAPRTAPVCVNCASANTELIKWADKETGEPKQAWKCQDCKQWLPNARKA